jgi:preprotein translocase SecE subunit
MLNRILNYLKESITELKKISWLNWKETLILTINIVLFVFLFVIIYWLFDFILLKLIFLR